MNLNPFGLLRSFAGFLRTFELGGNGPNQSRPSTSSKADDELVKKAKKMQAGIDFEVRNNGFARRLPSCWVRLIIGTGISPTASPKGKRTPKNIKTVIEKFLLTKACDYAGHQNISGLQRLIVRELFRSGGALVIRKMMPTQHRNVLPFKLQILSQTAIATSVMHPKGLTDDHYVRSGREYDSFNQIVAYWIQHEIPSNSRWGLRKLLPVRIPARDVIHIYEPSEADQTLGIPWGHASIPVLARLNDWTFATTMAQKVAACFGVLIHGTDEHKAPDKLYPGMIAKVSGTGGVTSLNPPKTQGHEPLANHLLRETAAGVDLSYELVSCDYRNVNFLSGRMARQDTMGQGAIHQDELSTQLLNPLTAWIYEGMGFMGLIVDGNIIWTPPAMWKLDPAKEVRATIDSLRSGLSDLEEIAGQRGLTVDELVQRISQGNAVLDKYGVTLDTDPRNISLSGVMHTVQATPEGDDE